MANICTNAMEISGDEKEIAVLAKKIEDQDTELLELFTWFEITDGDYGLWNDTLQISSGYIDFSYGSKWGPPKDDFFNLVKKYPRLSFKSRFEEPASIVYGKMIGEEFIKMSPLDYYTDYDQDFGEERLQIENLPYKEFLKYIEEFDVLDDWYYSFLIPLIVKRIKRKDLPLFIGKEWINNELEKLKE